MIKAIETEYNGIRFRSRTEARWAVFFDHAQIRYLYEPEGVIVKGQAYLPDFWLPEAKTWFEVKGTDPTPEESKLCQDLAIESGNKVLLAKGPPERYRGLLLYYPEPKTEPGWPKPEEAEYYICEDRRDEEVYWLASEFHVFILIARGEVTNHDRWPLIKGLVERGYLAASGARFEHGEKPIAPAKFLYG